MAEMNDKPDMGEEQARLLGLVEDLLREAKTQGVSGAEAAISVDRGLSASARLGEVETIEHHCDQGLGVTVYIGQRKGSASSTDLSPQSIRDTVSAACRIARYAAEDEYAGLPEPETLATDFPDLDLYHPWDLDADAAVALAIECEDAGRRLSPEITNSDGASLSTHQGFRVLGNSLGFLHGYASSRHSLSCALVGQRGEDMQRDYWYTAARAAGDLEPAALVGRKAAERTLRRLEGRPLATRQCPVLFCAEVAAGLLGHFVGAIRGGNLYRKSSFLLDCLGRPIFPAFVHIREQPHLLRALGSAPYDSEGVATRPNELVKDGVLCSYVLSTYSARKLGMATTGNAGGVHNLVIEPGHLDLPGLLAAMGTGLLVTELMGHGVNLVTGDYSRGAAGFWVENGEIQYPVEEITIAGNLREMLAGVVAVGNDVDARGNTRTGSLLIANMTVAGN